MIGDDMRYQCTSPKGKKRGRKELRCAVSLGFESFIWRSFITGRYACVLELLAGSEAWASRGSYTRMEVVRDRGHLLAKKRATYLIIWPHHGKCQLYLFLWSHTYCLCYFLHHSNNNQTFPSYSSICSLCCRIYLFKIHNYFCTMADQGSH